MSAYPEIKDFRMELSALSGQLSDLFLHTLGTSHFTNFSSLQTLSATALWRI
jgi:hypothetical protein